jgi:hypothetical protein
LKKNLTLYLDKRTGAALMVASDKEEAVYFPYNIDTGKFAYGMHGPAIAPNKLPTKYFQSLNPDTKRGEAGIAGDLEIVAVPD